MNGVAMPIESLAELKPVLVRETARLPPDLIYEEWLGKLAAEGHPRRQYVYKDNLLDHIGIVSSFKNRPPGRRWPKCYEPLANAWSLGKIQKFDARCKHSGLSPCS